MSAERIDTYGPPFMFGPPPFPTCHREYVFFEAARAGDIETIDRMVRGALIDPSVQRNYALRLAVIYGHLAIVDRLLQDKRVDPSDNDNRAIRWAAGEGHVAVLDRLLQDKRVDPSANENHAVRWAAGKGNLAVVERLLQDKRVDPSAEDNEAAQWAAANGEFAVVELLLGDDRVDSVVALEELRPEQRKRFECRERLTDICIGLQDMQLPAWVTLQILDAACPRSTLQLHSKWSLVCAVKHFHEKRARPVKA